MSCRDKSAQCGGEVASQLVQNNNPDNFASVIKAISLTPGSLNDADIMLPSKAILALEGQRNDTATGRWDIKSLLCDWILVLWVCFSYQTS